MDLINEEIDLTVRGSIEKGIADALKDCINCHGPITKEWVGSASKRVISAIKVYNREFRRKQRSRL